MASEKIKVLRVVSKRDGFGRAGFVFSAEPKDIPLADLSRKQRDAIAADRMLVAVELEVDVVEVVVGHEDNGNATDTAAANPRTTRNRRA